MGGALSTHRYVRFRFHPHVRPPRWPVSMDQLGSFCLLFTPLCGACANLSPASFVLANLRTVLANAPDRCTCTSSAFREFDNTNFSFGNSAGANDAGERVVHAELLRSSPRQLTRAVGGETLQVGTSCRSGLGPCEIVKATIFHCIASMFTIFHPDCPDF